MDHAGLAPAEFGVGLFCFRISVLYLRVPGSAYRLGFRVSGFGFAFEGFRLRGLTSEALGFRFSGFGFGVWGLGFGVSGFRFQVSG